METYLNGWVNYICDKCGQGRMIAQSSVLCVGSLRVLYRSICDEPKCGYIHNMLREYPQKIEDVFAEQILERKLYDTEGN
jgi:hypothetical protein